MGGMGNQMFQYALGRHLSLRHGVPLKLDLSGFDAQAPGDTPRRYALGNFRITAEAATSEEVDRVTGRAQRGARRILRRLGRWLRDRTGSAVVAERSMRFDPAVLDASPPAYLTGWWASPLYFRGIEETIRKDFALRNPPSGRNAELARFILDGESVSVHVRRGDYVTNPATRRVHGVCSPEYYRQALASIKVQVPDVRAFAFSDEIAWVRENMVLDAPTTHVDVNGPDDGHEDLRLMTLCRHHIIANSTFSWWGAWLCSHRAKKVIAPRRWSNDPAVDTRDLFPPDWELC